MDMNKIGATNINPMSINGVMCEPGTLVIDSIVVKDGTPYAVFKHPTNKRKILCDIGVLDSFSFEEKK